jgi:hypothetical protein
VVVVVVVIKYFSFPDAYELVVYPDIRRIGWMQLHSRTEKVISVPSKEKKQIIVIAKIKFKS